MTYQPSVLGQTALSEQCCVDPDENMASGLGLCCLTVTREYLDTSEGSKIDFSNFTNMLDS